jgi:predicted transport protein
MPKSPQEMKAAMIAGLAEKTGKPPDEWLRLLVQTSKLSKHKDIVGLLKTEHGLTHGFANMIALQALSSDSHTESDTDSLVDRQYFGAKAGLRPIYDAILTAVHKFGDDVEVSPKKAYVSLRRSKQFAIVQPSTNTRLDLGINLNDTAPQGRLEASGSFNAMLSHRVRISDLTEVDEELLSWLKRAYDGA